MKVIDASAMVEVLVGSPKAERLAVHLDDDLFAPDLLISESFSALRSMARRGQLTDDEATHLAGVLGAADVEYQHASHLAPRIWQLRHVMTSYDATYVALAEALRSPLLTTDGALARAATAYVAVIAI